MKEQLTKRLHSYLLENHMDLLISLQEDHRLKEYLNRKVSSVKAYWEDLLAEKRPEYVIEALCMEELTSDLRPSRFEFVRNLLEEEFEEDYRRMLGCGILSYEVINLIGACEPIFNIYGLTDDSDDRSDLRHAVIGMIAEYVNEGEGIRVKG
ncbi:DUF1896 family protein [Mucilaginibacter terrae]|uniref:DUF1896 family protein n=1 Tax=Mucilaginibacter terrae TaxID=1955052 RepID=A0ABU3GRB0_9SPHI|nr:DUF1896 family protein [Mucilaginibacter terrae]MDT3402315.1 hypothetical protein [Mucilaginibacter terrae]